MLREGDLFEVVLNPGADKREKRILGQITPLGRTSLYSLVYPSDTGGASLSASLISNSPDGSKSIAQLL
jgi:hypothetical protein